MTILSLTLFRRREEPDRTVREDASTGDSVLNRLEQMLGVDTVSTEQVEENETNEKTRGDAGIGLAAANPTAFNVVSAVAVVTPADEIEVEPLSVPAPIDEDTAEALASLGLESAAPNTTKWTQEDEDTDDRLTIALDEANAEAVARQLVEQERDRLREDTRRQVERLEQELADVYERLQTEAVLRRATEVELERLRDAVVFCVERMGSGRARCCHCGPASPNARPMTTSATGRPRCMPHCACSRQKRDLDRATPPDQPLHLILDNLSAHKSCVHFHFSLPM